MQEVIRVLRQARSERYTAPATVIAGILYSNDSPNAGIIPATWCNLAWFRIAALLVMRMFSVNLINIASFCTQLGACFRWTLRWDCVLCLFVFASSRQFSSRSFAMRPSRRYLVWNPFKMIRYKLFSLINVAISNERFTAKSSRLSRKTSAYGSIGPG